MWQHSSTLGPLAVLSLSFCTRRCAGALQVTTNITGSEIDFKERLLIEWSGDSQSSHDVGVQQQSASENGSFVLLSGRLREGKSICDYMDACLKPQVLTAYLRRKHR